MNNLTPEAVRAALEAATPGPWRVGPVDNTAIIAANGVDVGTTCDSAKAEREDAYNNEYERMEADASLIAMVPGLATAYLAMAEENERLMNVLHSIDVYGSDTLSGPSDGLANAKWFREGVLEMRNRARAVCDRHLKTLEMMNE